MLLKQNFNIHQLFHNMNYCLVFQKVGRFYSGYSVCCSMDLHLRGLQLLVMDVISD